jgi:hypothetical protein
MEEIQLTESAFDNCESELSARYPQYMSLLLTAGIPLIREVCQVITHWAWPERRPESTALHALLKSWDVDMLREPAVLELLLELIVVDVIEVLSSQKYHQIIMAIWSSSACVFLTCSMKPTYQRIFLQNGLSSRKFAALTMTPRMFSVKISFYMCKPYARDEKESYSESS